MRNPLETFIETLQKRHSSEAPAPGSSLPTHAQALDAFYSEAAKMERETKREGPLTLPAAPLQAGWLVVYRDQTGKLRGGADEREHGTVKECRWNGAGWLVALTSGATLSLTSIRAVGETNEDGRLLAAWTVREHGFAGTNTQT